MKNFSKPACEVIRFNSGIITSSACGCYDEDFGDLGTVCTGDVSYCNCKINHSPAQDNCTDCWDNQGA